MNIKLNRSENWTNYQRPKPQADDRRMIPEVQKTQSSRVREIVRLPIPTITLTILSKPFVIEIGDDNIETVEQFIAKFERAIFTDLKKISQKDLDEIRNFREKIADFWVKRLECITTGEFRNRVINRLFGLEKTIREHLQEERINSELETIRNLEGDEDDFLVEFEAFGKTFELDIRKDEKCKAVLKTLKTPIKKALAQVPLNTEIEDPHKGYENIHKTISKIAMAFTGATLNIPDNLNRNSYLSLFTDILDEYK